MSFGSVPKGIMARPYPFNAFAIGKAIPWREVAGILLMAYLLMRRLMELRNLGTKHQIWVGTNDLWPLSVNPLVEVDKPLTGNVVADEDEEEERALDGGPK